MMIAEGLSSISSKNSQARLKVGEAGKKRRKKRDAENVEEETEEDIKRKSRWEWGNGEMKPKNGGKSQKDVKGRRKWEGIVNCFWG
jgi:hypothetical protein